MSALVTSEIFRQFLNTLTPDEKYSRRYMKIFLQQWLPMTSIPVAIWRFSYNNLKRQTPLSQKDMAFFRFFFAFLKCAWNLQHSEKKEGYPSPIITEIIPSERDVYLSVWKVLLQHTIR